MSRTDDQPQTDACSIAAEEALIGALITDGRLFDEVSGAVQTGDFYVSEHRVIFDAVQNMTWTGIPVDIITVGEFLKRRGKLEKAGDLAYLGQLTSGIADLAALGHATQYAKMIREHAIIRELRQVAHTVATDAYNPQKQDLDALLHKAETAIFDIAEKRDRRRENMQALRDGVTETLDRIEELSHSDDPVTGVATGFIDLDRMTNGLQRGTLTVVGGRPSMGKTSLAMNIATHVAETGGRVVVFSLEMSREELTLRIIASKSQTDLLSLSAGKLDDEDWRRVAHAATAAKTFDMYLDDSGSPSAGEIRSRLYRIARQHGPIDLVLIDYLQLMDMDGAEVKSTRNESLAKITRALKQLAKELKVPVMLLSQLNRSLEDRTNKRPILSDLRDSGAIEQDADMVLFVYSDEVYKEDKELDPKKRGVAEVAIAKQRNGPVGSVYLRFDKRTTTFQNLAHEEATH